MLNFLSGIIGHCNEGRISLQNNFRPFLFHDSFSQVHNDQTYPYIHFWKKVIGACVFHKTSKSFIQPQMGPPFHCHQISKPLMCHFMCYDYRNLKVQINFEDKDLLYICNGSLKSYIFSLRILEIVLCSCDREKLLKFDIEGRKFAKNLRSLKIS